MSKKKTGSMATNMPKSQKKQVINMTKVELAKAYQVPGFRTGKYMTEKDRPRKKNWKKEYNNQHRKSEVDNNSDFLLYIFLIRMIATK